MSDKNEQSDRLVLQRIKGMQHGQFGDLSYGPHGCATLEQPFVTDMRHPAGLPGKSGLPAGEYELIKAHSPSFNGLYWYLVSSTLGVYLRSHERRHQWERYGCMFHPANWVRQLQGCIASGKEIHNFAGKDGYGVTSSKPTTKKVAAYIDTLSKPTILIRDARN